MTIIKILKMKLMIKKIWRLNIKKTFKLPIDTAIYLETYTKENNISQIDFINDLIWLFSKGDSGEGKQAQYEKATLNNLEDVNKNIKSLKLTMDSVYTKVNLFYEMLNSYFKSIEDDKIDYAFDYYNTKDEEVGKSYHLTSVEDDIKSYLAKERTKNLDEKY